MSISVRNQEVLIRPHNGQAGETIALHGLLRAGKGTIAGFLEEQYGFEVVKFAAPFKDMLRAYLLHAGLSPQTVERCVEGDLKNTRLVALGDRSARYVMQVLGSGWRQRFAPNIWSDIVDEKLQRAEREGGRIIIDDFRFPVPEAEMLSRHPSTHLWKVSRPEHLRLLAEEGVSYYEVRSFDTDSYHVVTPDVVDAMLLALRGHLGVRGWNDPIPVAQGLSLNDMAMMLRSWDIICPPQPEDSTQTRVHVSEQGMDDGGFDTVFRNEGTIEDLQSAVRDELSRLGIEPVAQALQLN